jgi:magnesium transporter/zinc transporter
MHRQVIGLHAVFARLERQPMESMPQKLSDAGRRIAQRLDTLHHDMHALGERARLLQDEVAAKQAAEANRLLQVISLLTALLVPPTLVTGIFGMNTKGLPFTDNPNAFIYAIGLCVASSLVVLFLMRRLFWKRS